MPRGGGGGGRSGGGGGGKGGGGGGGRSSGGGGRSSSGTYVNNSYNQSLGRVGMAYGTAVVSGYVHGCKYFVPCIAKIQF